MLTTRSARVVLINLGEIMKTLISIIVLGVIAVHGWMFVQYGSVDPCAAATQRVITTERAVLGRVLGNVLSDVVEKRLRSKGIPACYRIVFDGLSDGDLI